MPRQTPPRTAPTLAAPRPPTNLCARDTRAFVPALRGDDAGLELRRAAEEGNAAYVELLLEAGRWGPQALVEARVDYPVRLEAHPFSQGRRGPRKMQSARWLR